MREPNRTEQAEQQGGTRCCHTIAVAESIYANVPTEYGTGRRVIGYVPMCVKCHKVSGSVRFDNAPEGFMASAWNTMMRVHAHPPYYFTQDATGDWVPEGTTAVMRPAPQELAANDFEEPF